MEILDDVSKIKVRMRGARLIPVNDDDEFYTCRIVGRLGPKPFNVRVSKAEFDKAQSDGKPVTVKTILDLRVESPKTREEKVLSIYQLIGKTGAKKYTLELRDVGEVLLCDVFDAEAIRKHFRVSLPREFLKYFSSPIGGSVYVRYLMKVVRIDNVGRKDRRIRDVMDLDSSYDGRHVLYSRNQEEISIFDFNTSNFSWEVSVPCYVFEKMHVDAGYITIGQLKQAVQRYGKNTNLS